MLPISVASMPETYRVQLRQLVLVVVISRDTPLVNQEECLLVLSNVPLDTALRFECATRGVTLITPSDVVNLCNPLRKIDKKGSNGEDLYSGHSAWMYQYAPFFISLAIQRDEQAEFGWRIDDEDIVKYGIKIINFADPSQR